MDVVKFTSDSVPGKRILLKTGLLGDSHGIINRYIETEGAWDGHLNQCKHLIMQYVEGRNVENLAVYGSGWLLDLPIDKLSDVCGHVWLYDVVHPPQIRHKIRQYPNVSLITADITGGAVDWAFQTAKRRKKDKLYVNPEGFNVRSFVPLAEPDFVISLNILSQLGEVIGEFLVRNEVMEPEKTTGFRAKIQQAHLQQLPAGKSLLISDVTECQVSETGDLSEYPVVFCPLPVQLPVAEWIWLFDPVKTYRSMETRLKVKAWLL